MIDFRRGFKMCIFYEFGCNMTLELLTQIIKCVEECGARVRAVVSILNIIISYRLSDLK